MPTLLECPTCGQPLEPNAPQGLCPACLLRAGFPTGTQVAAAAVDPRARFEPPKPEQLAECFPQLEILEFIGQGGMGAVYKARQPTLDRLVALKILPPRVGKDPGFADRFTREARALARLSHPNIVAVHDFGQAGSFHYFIMEYVDGLNLRQIEQAGKLAPREALQIIPQICEALQYAHDAGIVHRDIKPENILLDKRGRVKIADFGLAKLLGSDQPGREPVTEAGQVMGTPHYMAPEQVERPLEVDHRADIYSLGVVFYEMLTGELPLGKFAAPSDRAPMDQRLDEVVLRTLEKAPQERYQQASEVKTALEDIATGRTAEASEPEFHRGRRLALWLGALLIALGFLILDGTVRLRAIADVTASSVPGQPVVVEDPHSVSGYPYNQHRLIVPAIGTAGYAWMIETERMLVDMHTPGGSNTTEAHAAEAQEGRWSSSLHWLAAGLAWGYCQYTGAPIGIGVAWAAPWVNTVVLGVLMAGFTPVIARRFGAAAAAIFATGCVAVYPFYEFFIVGYFYDHGVTAAGNLLMVLCLAGGGAGWLRGKGADSTRLGPAERTLWIWLPDAGQARWWFAASAVTGAAAWWMSATSEKPVFFGAGLGPLASVWVAGLWATGWLGRGTGSKSPWRPEPALWRWWGQVGAVACLGFYFLEYAPANFGERAEVVLRGLAWLGAGDLLARLCGWMHRGRLGDERAPASRAWLLMGLDVGLVALLPITLWLAASDDVAAGNAFLWRLKTDYYIEYRGLWRQLAQLNLQEILAGISLISLTIFPMAWLLFLGRLEKPWRALLAMALCPATVFLGMAMRHILWLGVDCALWLAALVTLVFVLARAGSGKSWGLWQKAGAAGFLAVVLLPYPCFTLHWLVKSGFKNSTTMLDTCEIITRDAAYRLRQRLGPEQGMLIGGPTTNEWMRYFGGFQTLGDVGQEDYSGLQTEAAIYAAATPEKALALLQKSGVTNLAIFSWDPFAEEYAKLARGLGRQAPAQTDSVLVQLVENTKMPDWLRPIYYALPANPQLKGQWVLMADVVPNQSKPDAALHMAQYLWAQGKDKEARAELQRCLTLKPDYLPALITAAQFEDNRGGDFAAAVKRVESQPGQVATLDFEDRVRLAMVLMDAGEPEAARQQMQSALATADEHSVRRLPPDVLAGLVTLAAREHLDAEYSPIVQFARGLQPST